MSRRHVLLTLLFLLLALAAAAQGGPADEETPLRIMPAAGSITVDGGLEDAGWKGAAEVSTFYDIDPGDSVAPPVKTAAWITYDERYLYIAFRCDDPAPSKIRAPYVDRDSVGSDQDFAGVFLDTRGNGRSALELFVNPRGIHDDGVKNDATGTEDMSPDFFWDSAAKITSNGWQMEMRIPFSSLRYAKEATQAWGIIFYRNYPRQFRYQITSVKLPRGGNCLLCHELKLVGLESLPSSSHLTVAPYLGARKEWQAEDGPGAPMASEPARYRAGVDAKWIPDANNALDFTFNPDFSQVESDTAQISVNQRFAIFYPEKRPFFMEGVDLLETPIQAVYTRTMASPRWGARATGNLLGTDYTFLAVQDQGGGSLVIPGPQSSQFVPLDASSQVAILRARKSYGGSFAGFLVTSRQYDGGGYNRVFGPDFQWNPNDKDRLTGQLLLSMTRTPDRPDVFSGWDGTSFSASALHLSWVHSTRTWNLASSYEEVGDGFRADDGYVPQSGYRWARQWVAYDFYPDNAFFSRVEPYLNLSQNWNRSGSALTGRWAAGVNGSGKHGLYADATIVAREQQVGTALLHFKNGNFTLNWSPGYRISRVSIYGDVGQQIDYDNAGVGHGGTFRASVTSRATGHLTLEFVGQFAWLDVKVNGASGRLYSASVERLKGVYTLSARTFLRLIAQWEGIRRNTNLYPVAVPEKTGDLSGSFLYAYRVNWQTVLYIGYGDTHTLAERAQLVPADRAIFFKLSYAFQQ